ncbi:MAG: hypothetical protein R3E88_13640 [Myxococcota bacterium]
MATRPLRPLRALVAAVVAAATTACAPIWVPIEVTTPRPFPMPTFELAMDLPVGWMSSYYGPAIGHFFFTRHGAELQQFWVRRWPKTQVVKGTNRSITSGMTVQDVAMLSLDSRRLDEGVGALEVVSNRPVELGRQACYRLDYRYRDAIGLPRRAVEYGCPVGAWMYRFEYMAPEQHYFDRYLPDFEASVATVVFETAGAS